MTNIPEKFDQVSVVLKANVYFDGKVVSHTVVDARGAKKTLGLIYPGTYLFNTGAPERMTMTGGSSQYRLAGQDEWLTCAEGSAFEVPANSSFEIRIVDKGVAQYLCEFL